MSKIFILSTCLTSLSTCVLAVKVIDIVVGKDNLVEETSEVGDILMQGCISCGILVSGIGARGVSSEHMENMEMFSLSPT